MNPLPVSLPFADRAEAGRRLAERARPFAAADPIVVALPRGGVPVGAELARRLRVPLDILMVRKIGLPDRPEVGVGAIAEDGHVSFDDDALARLRTSRAELAGIVRAERAELARRLATYRGSHPSPRLTGRDVIVVDDGAATGGTARAALRMVRRQRPNRLILAVPVGAPGAVRALRSEADHLVVLTVPENFHAVGEWYRDFTQLTDEYVTAVLAEQRVPAAESDSERGVRIRAGGDVHLDGDLSVPPSLHGAVVFALGHGRHDPRQRAAAAIVRRAGYATLLLDLFTESEWRRANGTSGGIGPDELGDRLGAAVRWLRRASAVADRPVGLVGSGTGAAAALVAAARHPDDVAAVVAQGGRIDLAENRLAAVRAPVLVLVEGNDPLVRELTEWALGRLGGPFELRVAAHAEHEPEGGDAWRAAGTAAAEWFESHRRNRQ
ncbi:putative phosphoribosyl transferase [Murinocardiopsis flavida]|uniref:Putative phosphoribosyl transferase n=1 Tax=Murinocardiopsis flavida TaxID=645275 RepID=A0A2P8DLW2_9ACTN|nr:phosphoribosyltransferase family protein [Murinocardiopsis flavida]PSK98167.1 putative phosphoribosyl transferase [Murinocardiopsis flavida]